MNLKQVTGKSRISDGRFKAFSQRQQDELDEEWNWFVNSESSYKGGEEIAKELRNLLETAQSQEDISAIRKKRSSLLSYCGKYIDRSYFKSLDSRLAAEKYLSEIYMSEEDYQNMLNEARQRVYSNVSDSRRIKDDSESVFQEFVNFLGEVEDESKDNSSMQPVMIHITRNHYNQNYVDVDFEILVSPAKFDLIMCSSVSLYGNDLKGVVNELLVDMDSQIKDIARRDYGVAEMVASEIGCTPEEVLDNDVEFCGAFIPVKDYIAQKIKSNISDSRRRRVKDSGGNKYYYDLALNLVNPETDDRSEPYENLDIDMFTDQKESIGYDTEEECYEAAIARAEEYYEEGEEFFADDTDIKVEGVLVSITILDDNLDWVEDVESFDLFKNGAGEFMTY